MEPFSFLIIVIAKLKEENQHLNIISYYFFELFYCLLLIIIIIIIINYFFFNIISFLSVSLISSFRFFFLKKCDKWNLPPFLLLQN